MLCAVCQSQLPLPQWEGKAHCWWESCAVVFSEPTLLPEKYQSEINDKEHYKQHPMKINVKCLYYFKLRGERIMFKHSLDIEANSAILYHLSTAVFCPSKNSNYYT